MSQDYTQQQTLGDLQASEKLSLQATVPPVELPGFRMERLLGQGAFGQVWMARDLNTGRDVAIKFFLNRSNASTPMLDREVAHMVNMSTGRHVVQVLAVGWDSTPPYFVMDYLENGSLEDLLRSRGTLSILECVSIFRELAEGLTFVHAKGILHCDLKPANVLLDHAWKPRLADFGQGRMSHEQAPSLGTLFYMAPEQANLDASPDAAWDVYALGAIAYAMLVGSPPYRTKDVVERLDTAATLPERLQQYRGLIETTGSPKLHHRRRGADKGLCQIVDRCLAADPNERYSNAQQVVEALDALQASRSRRPLYLMGIVGPVLLLLLMLVFSARSISTATERSLASVSQRSLESNQFAARFVAQSVEREIEDLFRLVEGEAKRPQLAALLKVATEDNQAQLKRLVSTVPDEESIEQLKASESQKRLQEYLAGRLRTLFERNGNADTTFNSLFVNDAQGTNVAIAFSSAEKPSGSPVGKNFAYRSYFTGLRSDGSAKTERSRFSPTRETHLSASFRSTTTGAWKVGVSTPVWETSLRDADGRLNRGLIEQTQAMPLGVIVLTINLGDFQLLADAGTNESEDGTRFSALVDGRKGNQNGTLLQHPLIRNMDRELMKTVEMPQIPEPVLGAMQRDGGISNYVDPARKFDNGSDYEGEWIAAVEQVTLPRAMESEAAATRKESDLWILIQERKSSVAQPIRALGDQLQWETYFEFASLLMVIVTLWFFVFRLGKSPKRAFEGRSEGTVDPRLEVTVEHSLPRE